MGALPDRSKREIVARLDRYEDAYARAYARDPAAADAYFNDLFARFVASRPEMQLDGRTFRVTAVFFVRRAETRPEVWATLAAVTDSVNPPAVPPL